MSRINAQFERLQSEGRKALIPFITAGDPDAKSTLIFMHELVNAGADIIELGVPFSDPMADGPIIQKAGERALAAGMTLAGVLDLVRQFRADNTTTPVVLMGYLNPMEAMGIETFAQHAQAAGVDGVLTVDVPLEEADDLLPALESVNIAPIFLVAPTSSVERIKRTAELARGYVYYVSLKGITGAASLDIAVVADKMTLLQQYIQIPVGVGFGIRDANSAAAIAKVADAVVVGSALVERIAANLDKPEQAQVQMSTLLSSMRQAMDQV